jgi:transcription initiation factor TFIIIB Brf1 subunit/transcription initiation factor TFIIB
MQSEPPQNPRTEDESNPESDSRCPDCNGTDLDESIETVDAVCDDCGYVIHDFANPGEFLKIDSNKETDRIDSEGDRGQNRQYDWTDVYTVTNSTEQRLATAYESLEHLADVLVLPTEVRKRAASVIATAAKENVIDGRPTEAVVAALVYITAREAETPRPLVLVAENIKWETRQLERLVRSLHCELNLEHHGCHPEEYLPYLRRELGYAEPIEQRAREWIDAARQAGLTNGKSPTGCAGAALYFASDGEQSQRTVAAAVGVSKETIRLRLKEFREEGVGTDERL